jgi:uncharacterized membrane protein
MNKVALTYAVLALFFSLVIIVFGHKVIKRWAWWKTALAFLFSPLLVAREIYILLLEARERNKKKGGDDGS